MPSSGCHFLFQRFLQERKRSAVEALDGTNAHSHVQSDLLPVLTVDILLRHHSLLVDILQSRNELRHRDFRIRTGIPGLLQFAFQRIQRHGSTLHLGMVLILFFYHQNNVSPELTAFLTQ